MPLREIRREGGIKTQLLAVEDLEGSPVKSVSFDVMQKSRRADDGPQMVLERDHKEPTIEEVIDQYLLVSG